MQRLRHALVDGSIAQTGGANLLVAALNVTGGLILARSLGPSARGELAAALVWPMACITFGDLGLSFAIAYHVGRDKRQISALWTLAWCVGLVVGGGVAAAGLFALLRWHAGFTLATARAMKVGMLSVPFTLTGGYNAFLLLGMGRTRDYNLCKLYAAAAYFLAIALVAVSGLRGVLSFAIAYTAPQIGNCGLTAALLWHRARPRWTVDRGVFGQVLRYGAKTYVSGLASQANLRLDQLVMSLILAPKELGQYVVAVGISGLLLPLYSSVSLVTLPRVLHSQSQRAGIAEAFRLLRLTVAWGAPAALALCAAMPWVISFVFGPAYKPAAWPAAILIGGSLLQGVIMIEANALRAVNRPGAPAIAELVGLGITLLMLTLLLRPLGTLGAAIASVSAYSVVAIGQWHFLAAAAPEPAPARCLSTPIPGALHEN